MGRHFFRALSNGLRRIFTKLSGTWRTVIASRLLPFVRFIFTTILHEVNNRWEGQEGCCFREGGPFLSLGGGEGCFTRNSPAAKTF